MDWRSGRTNQFQPQSNSLLTKILDKEFSDRFETLNTFLTSTIDFKESIRNKFVVVNTSTSNMLHEKRNFFAVLPEFLTAVAQEEVQKLRLARCSMVYLPMFGFLIKVRF